MKKITIIAFFAALGMISCKDTKAEATTTTETPTTETAPVDPHAGHNHTPGEGHDHETAAPNTAAPATQATTANTKTAAGMNPPHGQPGHRCDIPVGAPLNSPPGQGAQQQATQSTAPKTNGRGFLGGGTTQAAQQQQAAPQQQQQAMPAQQTAPGMQGKPNPAHGQPGHRCDVAVGQPLP